MAWIFSLSAECGSDQSNVNKFAQHFEGIEWLLSNGRQCQCRTDTFQDMEQNWWCRVYPNNISEVGIDSSEIPYVMTELGIPLFYKPLRVYPSFRYPMEQNWWSRVDPNNISERGMDSPESAYVMTELGILFYQTLWSAPSFRYALVGVEVDEFRTYSELMEDLPNLFMPGLVLAKELTLMLEILPGFRPFSSNYIWQPYAGEIYNPLIASPDLKNKLNELLAGS
ncbi:conserved hypothetical protein [Planktothrix sp. PCC 11201]|uniref:hypothetical protein n=1 Tax=Planktothrix sp. PCC 11201 TaxID=1729650 RepID=UPI0009117492|nr:hypothetical protein [Planktothrix sp. PCC 11201]SKB13450.1 conserved hypothetical protein [Planktothrix sp. PCC 11201]